MSPTPAEEYKITDLTPSGVTCPECHQGELVPARGRFGAIYKCNADSVPKCAFFVTSRPTGDICSYVKEDGRPCGKIIVEGTRAIPDRCSDRDCPNRNPHKLGNN